MSTLQITLLSIFGPLLLAGGATGTKLYGDRYIWVAQSEYQQEKLYDLQDERDLLLDRKEIEGIDEIDARTLKRLLKRIKRLEEQSS
jgi:hypothetical protein